MEIILSHRQHDFDSLASMVAAQKLYPGSVMVMEGNANPYVQEFLALSKDQLPIKKAKDIDLNNVKRIVLVDMHDLRRTGELGKRAAEMGGIPVEIYDHHPFDGPRGQGVVIEPVGACATLLVERLAEIGMALNGFEATVIALGIYEDTGSLLFESTTVRDVLAVGYLLKQGANLGVVAEYLRKPLTEEQKNIFYQLLENGKQEMRGQPVFISWAESADYVGGLALLARRVEEMENAETTFLAVKMENRIYIIGRSRGRGMDVSRVAAAFGGAGHRRAASAAVKENDLAAILTRLRQKIGTESKNPSLARDMMSFPVKTITSHTTLAEAGQILLRCGHTGVPVKDGERLVGIISRRDVEKALKHGLGHAPVKGFMATELVTAASDASWETVRNLMVQHDVGRIPVLEAGKLVGIISRSDMLRFIHGESVPVESTLVHERSQAMRRDIIGLLERTDPQIRKIVDAARRSAETGHYSVFIVGGFVRDLLLLNPTQDLDLVVEGNGIRYADALAAGLPEGELARHEEFGTARLTFKDGTHVDIAGARWEYYEYPGALPQVEESTLRQDLFRRDFTINAMAISLAAARFAFGDLVDYYGGYGDLQQGKIRFLHNLSFIDDPTRMLRAVRFAGRYDFSLAAETRQAMQTALQNGMLRRLSAERFTEELLYILAEEKCWAMGQELVDSGILAAWFERSYAWNFAAPENFLREWPVYKRWLTAVSPLSDGEIDHVMERLRLPKKIKDSTTLYQRLRKNLAESETLALAVIDPLLSKCDRQVLEVLAADSRFKSALTAYLKALDQYKPAIDGKRLVQMGVKQGRAVGELLNELRLAWLRGEIHSAEEEYRYLDRLLKSGKTHHKQCAEC